MFNTVYIHVGLPKTGSSYLQSGLECLSKNNRLKKVCYPLKPNGEVFSGNGVGVAAQLVPELFPVFKEDQLQGELGELLERGGGGGDLLISSEDFFSASVERFECFKQLLIKYAKNIKLIAVVRPLEAWAYSYYMQMVKRHGVSREFDADWLYAFQQEILEKFESLEKFSVETLVLPYCSRGLLGKFLHLIGESSELALGIPDVKINRSLTFEELRLLKMVNDVFGCPRLSRMISDEFIKIASDAPMASFEGGGAVFYSQFRSDLLKKFDAFDAELLRNIKQILFEVETRGGSDSLESTRRSEIYLLEVVLSKIKIWMDEGGDLHKLKEYAEKNLVRTEGFFDPIHYLIINQDVLTHGVDPCGHYQKHGKDEGRYTGYLRK